MTERLQQGNEKGPIRPEDTGKGKVTRPPGFRTKKTAQKIGDGKLGNRRQKRSKDPSVGLGITFFTGQVPLESLGQSASVTEKAKKANKNRCRRNELSLGWI
jgi:hypothetical protein